MSIPCDHCQPSTSKIEQEDLGDRQYVDGEDEGPLSYVSLQEAMVFLFAFHAQVLTGLNELKSIEAKMDPNVCCRNHTPDEELEMLKREESYANTTFMKLRSRLCNFMNQRKGIQLI